MYDIEKFLRVVGRIFLQQDFATLHNFTYKLIEAYMRVSC